MIFNVSKLTGHFMIRVFTERYLIRLLKYSLFRFIFMSVLLSGSLQTHHVYSLKQRGNSRFNVVSTCNTRGVFVGLFLKIPSTLRRYSKHFGYVSCHTLLASFYSVKFMLL